MNLTTIINMFVGSLISTVGIVICGSKLLNIKFKFSFKNIIIVICQAIFTTLNCFLLNNVLKMLVLYIAIAIVYKLVFKTSFVKCFLTAFIVYLFMAISEIVCAIILNLLFKTEDLTYFVKIAGTIFPNTIVTIFLIMFTMLTNKGIAKLINNLSSKRQTNVILTSLVVLLTLSATFYKLENIDWKLNYEFVLNSLIIVGGIIIGLFLLKQKMSIDLINSKYQKEYEYAKNSSELVRDYGIRNHEYKNEIIIIKGLANPKNTKLLNYINELEDKYKMEKYCWINQLINVPITGLNSLLNHKITSMKNMGINVSINISKELGKINEKKYSEKEKSQIYNLFGVYLDNAIEASIESVNKEISIEGFCNKKEIVFIVANTYKKEIDLTKINNPGFSTKGINRGYGRSLANSIVESNKKITIKSMIDNKYFVQYIMLKKSE